MEHAFPEDELRPISCTPLTRDRENPAHIEVNDPLGNYSLTLVDSLSTLAILASTPPSRPGGDGEENPSLREFQDGVKQLIRQYGDGSTDPSLASARGAREAGFDLDSKVQVFETVIRGLGGLLSAHLFAIGELPIAGYEPRKEAVEYASRWDKEAVAMNVSGIHWDNGLVYDGQLLRLAYDLGNRLIPAFYTETGIPYPRVNLRTGIPFHEKSPQNFDPEDGQCDAARDGSSEITETCPAGAGSLILEMTVLSRLTGDSRFETLGKRSFWAVWERRSALDLLGTGIDAETGQWVGSHSGIGAGVDSFLEYAFKSYVLLSNDFSAVARVPRHAKDPRQLFAPLTSAENSPLSFLRVWTDSHSAIKRHLYRGKAYQHPHYVQGDLHTGATKALWQDSLSAFYPGLLAFSGYLDEAVEAQLLLTALWTRFSALPERWNVANGGVEGGLSWWGGRPELVESAYYLYRATADPWYLHVGEMILHDIVRRCRTSCGWAGIQDVTTGQLSDRMESFFLGETAKYLFLLFDDDHPLNHLDSPFVFTTEGHPLIIPPSVGRGSMTSIHDPVVANKSGPQWSAGRPQICPKPPRPVLFGLSYTAGRDDIFHAALLARLPLGTQPTSPRAVATDFIKAHSEDSHYDVASPSNFSYFPWTLPPALIAQNATSAPLSSRSSLDISFPMVPSLGSPSVPLKRVEQGVWINNVGGLRLGMVQDVPMFVPTGSGEGFRIHAINNLALGRDEKVFLTRETTSGVLNPTDPYFTRVRDAVMMDLVIDLGDWDPHPDVSRSQNSTASNFPVDEFEQRSQSRVSGESVQSTIGSILNHFNAFMGAEKSSLFPFSFNLGPDVVDQNRLYIPAIAAWGKGAAPIPDWKEAPSLRSSAAESTAGLTWSTIHATDELCDHTLPGWIVKQHQVLVVKRGGCSFWDKLANIPAFVPSPQALHLVVVVSDGGNAPSNPIFDVEKDEDTRQDSDGTCFFQVEEAAEATTSPTEIAEDHLIRPLLDKEQRTTTGLLRRHPLPLLLVGGGEQMYQALSQHAKGVAIKRRYSIEAQGVKITNLIIV